MPTKADHAPPTSTPQGALDRLAGNPYLESMTVKLDLNPDVEAGLTALAQAQGLSLEDYVAKVLRERTAPRVGAATGTAAKAQAWAAWAGSHRSVGSLTDESLRREHLVRDAR